jgi:peptidoglycan/LPS O-acetylase OafA/YrhL
VTSTDVRGQKLELFREAAVLNTTSHRNQSLDVLRCLAIVLVLGHHTPYYRPLAQMGWIGVDLFFVLSGFLISGLLFDEFKKTGSIDFWRFFIRRGLKIWPPFFMFLCAVIIGQSISPAHRVSWPKVAETALFLQSYLSGGVAQHTWSLAVEEHFYVALPPLLALLIFLRRGRENPFASIPVIFLVVSVICLTLRWQYGYREALMTHLRIDSLFAGVTLGYLYHFKPSRFGHLKGNCSLAIAAACCFPTLFIDRIRYQVLGLTFLFVGFGFLVAWSIDRRPRSKAGRVILRCAAKIGFYSYSIYLWHPLVLNAISAHVPSLTMSVFWLCMSACIAVGIGMAILIETPALALRNKKFPSVASTNLRSVAA